MSEVNKRRNGLSVPPECIGWGSAADFCGLFAVSHCRPLRGHTLPLPLGEVAERCKDGEGKQIDLIIQKAACLYLPQAAAYRFSPLSRLRRQLSQRESQGSVPLQSIKTTLISLILALPRRESKGNRARFLFGGSRVEVFRRRGKRNPRLLNDSLVTFCSHRKSPCGAFRSWFQQKFSFRTPLSEVHTRSRSPQKSNSERRAPLLSYLYICCLYTDGVTPSKRLNTAMKLLIFMYPVSSAICEMLLFVSRSSSFASAIFLRFM